MPTIVVLLDLLLMDLHVNAIADQQLPLNLCISLLAQHGRVLTPLNVLLPAMLQPEQLTPMDLTVFVLAISDSQHLFLLSLKQLAQQKNNYHVPVQQVAVLLFHPPILQSMFVVLLIPISTPLENAHAIPITMKLVFKSRFSVFRNLLLQVKLFFSMEFTTALITLLPSTCKLSLFAFVILPFSLRKSSLTPKVLATAAH